MDSKKISEVSRIVGLSERRIREYERAGLIRPGREERTCDRLFSPVEVSQLTVLKRLVNDKKFTLENLKMLLSYGACWELTGCRNRDHCAVLKDPTTPCYLQSNHACPGDNGCQRCPIYLSKEKPREPLIIREVPAADTVPRSDAATGPAMDTHRPWGAY